MESTDRLIITFGRLFCIGIAMFVKMSNTDKLARDEQGFCKEGKYV